MLFTEVPDHIRHLDLTRALRSLGFNPDNLHGLELRPNGVYADVFHRSPTGRLVWTGHNQYARHRIWIPVLHTDGDPQPSDQVNVSD